MSHAVWWEFRTAMAYHRWCAEFSAAISRIGWIYYADCRRSKR